jgi:hypothetical protein
MEEALYSVGCHRCAMGAAAALPLTIQARQASFCVGIPDHRDEGMVANEIVVSGKRNCRHARTAYFSLDRENPERPKA